ncbi:hypothetical protein KR100_14490 [Synechococcus sp. KORDI-100]|nr:hypothetical protein KR100_14490 [Synechococcus sp. KORDI-100]
MKLFLRLDLLLPFSRTLRAMGFIKCIAIQFLLKQGLLMVLLTISILQLIYRLMTATDLIKLSSQQMAGKTII